MPEVIKVIPVFQLAERRERDWIDRFERLGWRVLNAVKVRWRKPIAYFDGSLILPRGCMELDGRDLLIVEDDYFNDRVVI